MKKEVRSFLKEFVAASSKGGPDGSQCWLLIGRERSRAGGTSGDVTSGKRPLTSGKNRLWAQATADQWKKLIVGSRWVKTADQWKKSMVGSRWVKTADQWKKGVVGSGTADKG